MKIFNVFATALSYFLAGITFMVGMWWTMVIWFVFGTVNLFVCMAW